MSLSTLEKPKFTNKPVTSVGLLNAATAGSLGSDTNGVTVYTPGSYGGRIESLIISTDDTSAVNVFVYILNGSTVKPLGIVNVPAASGNSATTASIDALAGTGITIIGALLDNTGKRYISLGVSDILKVAVLANMTASKKCHVTAQGFDFTADPTS